MKYICAQPLQKYFAWQIDVMLTNFLVSNINKDDIHILILLQKDLISLSDFQNLEKKYGINFYYYQDTRTDLSYTPSIYFNAVKQHFLSLKELEKETIFFHDCDIVFTKKINFSHLEQDQFWYLSDTNAYINSSYILSKGREIYDQMCLIIGIDQQIPIQNNEHSGGAQYITKNTNFDFWNKVEQDSISLYNYFCGIEAFYEKKHQFDYPIQKWTSGMWSLLWNSWLFGHTTKVIHELNFCWATDLIAKWSENNIMHNSGVTSETDFLFNKLNYQHSFPYQENFKISEKVDQKFCSYEYAKIIDSLK